jgi:hypothetical protein
MPTPAHQKSEVTPSSTTPMTSPYTTTSPSSTPKNPNREATITPTAHQLTNITNMKLKLVRLITQNTTLLLFINVTTNTSSISISPGTSVNPTNTLAPTKYQYPSALSLYSSSLSVSSPPRLRRHRNRSLTQMLPHTSPAVRVSAATLATPIIMLNAMIDEQRESNPRHVEKGAEREKG